MPSTFFVFLTRCIFSSELLLELELLEEELPELELDELEELDELLELLYFLDF